MIKKYGLSLVAVIIACGMLAFKTDKANPTTEQEKLFTQILIWYQVDASGNPINSSNGQAGANPFGCAGVSVLCARALTYDPDNSSASEVTLNADGITYTIKSGVDITSASYYDDERKKPNG